MLLIARSIQRTFMTRSFMRINIRPWCNSKGRFGKSTEDMETAKAA